MSPKLSVSIIVLIAVVVGTAMSTFVIDEREQALVMQFGNPKRAVQESGLHVKWPWQNVVRFDDRLLVSDAPVTEVITQDKKTILVDHYTRWRITDPLRVYQVARNERGVNARLQDIARGMVREVLGQHTLTQIVSGGESEKLRAELMDTIRDRADSEVSKMGIHVVDVRIKRADLPGENSKAVFERMKAERERIAKAYRSEGQEAAQVIRGEANKERQELIAEGVEQAEKIRGAAEAEANAIYARVHERDREFYAFMRSLEAYRGSIEEDTRLVISPESEFFRFFEKSR